MISSLSNASFEEVYRTFIEAFKDYEVKIDMSIDRFKEMLITRSYNKNFSLGFYEKSILVGFLLIGYREIGNKKIFYDAGTGIINEYRRKGIGYILLNEIKKIMRQSAINTFLLEVLEKNTPAIQLYKKNGFKIRRRLNCYNITKVEYFNNSIKFRRVKEMDIEERINQYCSFEPTWQNSYLSY